MNRFWLGSVAEGVLRDLECGALVIPVGVADRLRLPVRVGQGDLAEPVE
jgi:hypothetical protein